MIVAGRAFMKRRRRPVRNLLDRLRRLFRREPEQPDDPYALVGAPKKPRLPGRSAAAAEPLDS
jgi:hypothetical protein